MNEAYEKIREDIQALGEKLGEFSVDVYATIKADIIAATIVDIVSASILLLVQLVVFGTLAKKITSPELREEKRQAKEKAGPTNVVTDEEKGVVAKYVGLTVAMIIVGSTIFANYSFISNRARCVAGPDYCAVKTIVQDAKKYKENY